MCLKLVADTIDKLQGEKYCFYGYLLLSLICLRRKLVKIQEEKKLNYVNHYLKAYLKALTNDFRSTLTFVKMGSFPQL